MQLLNHTVRVAGIVQHGKGARKFLPIATLQDWTGSQGKASIFYVKVDDPKNISAVEDEIHNAPGMQQYVVRSMAEYLSLMTAGNLPGLPQVHHGGDWRCGGHRIHRDLPGHVHGGDGAHARDRHPEVAGRVEAVHHQRDLARDNAAGDMRDHRWRDRQLRGETRPEAALRDVANRYQHRLDVAMQIVIALAGAMLGAIYPAFKAAQKDPIEALAYE